MGLDPILHKVMLNLENYWNVLNHKIHLIEDEDPENPVSMLLDCIAKDLEDIVADCGFTFETLEQQKLRSQLDEAVSLDTMLNDLKLFKSSNKKK